MGPRMCQMLATLCVTSALALVALGGSNLTAGFHLGTLSVVGPSTIVVPILDTVAISLDVEGRSCDALGWRVNSCLLHLFTALARPHRFASSVVMRQGYKAGGCSCAQHMSSHMISHHFPASFPVAKKKETSRNICRNRKELLSLHGVASPSLLNHGGAGLVRIRGHVGAPTKPR
jgi:hypothetical protein